jgi:hypothetical protein
MAATISGQHIVHGNSASTSTTAGSTTTANRLDLESLTRTVTNNVAADVISLGDGVGAAPFTVRTSLRGPTPAPYSRKITTNHRSIKSNNTIVRPRLRHINQLDSPPAHGSAAARNADLITKTIRDTQVSGIGGPRPAKRPSKNSISTRPLPSIRVQPGCKGRRFP